MIFDAVTIERMVREVLSQTQATANVRDNTASKPKTPEKLLSVPVVTAPASAILTSEVPQASTAAVIRERIVTADLLKEQATPGTKIVIAKRAIITPAAQDYLRNYRIAFERADTSPTGNSLSTARWKILVSGVAEHTVRAVETVCQQRGNTTKELVGNVTESVSLAVSAICRAEVAGVIVVSASPDVVACRANRNSAVRAAVISDLATWQRVQPQLKPNVVCISPQGRGFMELQNILNKVVTGPAPEVPGDWA